MHSVYLDHNATTPVRAKVAEAVSAALSVGGNPSSVHGVGRRARMMVEEARDQVASLVGASPAEIVFTGGGTEANNMALRAAPGDKVMVSSIEHVSVLEVVENPMLIPATSNGVVDLGRLSGLLAECDGPALVSVMLANNETGVLQPVQEIVGIARKHSALVHCDAIQAVGKIPVDWRRLGVDMLSLSAHKLGGPQGVGALIVDQALTLAPLTRGGGQERSRRAGTENVAGIVGFGIAAAEALEQLDQFARLAEIRDRVESDLPAAIVFGGEAERLPNTSCLAMPGMTSETQVMAFDLSQIMLSAGSACSSGKVQASHVLAAMGVDQGIANSAIRISLGWNSCQDDGDRFVAVWRELHDRAQMVAA